MSLDSPSTNVKLVQNGTDVTGFFGHKGGEIFGLLEGNVVNFEWVGSGTRSGTGKWEFQLENNEINGSWNTGHGIDMSGKWNLIRIE